MKCDNCGKNFTTEQISLWKGDRLCQSCIIDKALPGAKATCGKCGKELTLSTYRDMGRWEPDYDPDDDPVVWRHSNGYASCGTFTSFATPTEVVHANVPQPSLEVEAFAPPTPPIDWRQLPVPSIDALHLERQRIWSTKIFGPGKRTKGVIQHIRKELVEIEADPDDLGEWVDVIILAFDGAWRHGWEPQEIINAVIAKQTKNEAREWPDWRTMSEDVAIEHDRTKD